MQSRGVEHMLRVVPPALCARVREKVLRHAASAASGRSLRDQVVLNFLGYHPNSDVQSPRHRQHVALGWTDDVESILRLATRAAAPAFARAEITHGSRLVELSSMVAFPGAEEQNVHSDVRPDAKRRICTLWVALQMVESANVRACVCVSCLHGPRIRDPQPPPCLHPPQGPHHSPTTHPPLIHPPPIHHPTTLHPPPVVRQGPTFYYPRDPNDLDSFDWKRLTGEAVGPVVYGADGEVEYDPNAAMDTDDHPFKGVEPARCLMDAGDAFLVSSSNRVLRPSLKGEAASRNVSQ